MDETKDNVVFAKRYILEALISEKLACTKKPDTLQTFKYATAVTKIEESIVRCLLRSRFVFYPIIHF